MRNAKIRKIYGVCFLICTALLLAAFVVQALKLYFGGGYTVEGVAEKLKQLILPSLLWVIFLLVGVAVYDLFPVESKKPRVAAKPLTQIKRMASKLPEGAWSAGRKSFKRKLTTVWAVAGGLCGVLFFFPLCYLLNPSHFNYSSTNEEMVQAALHTLPFVGAAFVVVAVAMLLQSYFARVALGELKQLTIAAAKAGQLQKGGAETLKEGWLENKKHLWILRGIILVASVFLIVFGIANGGLEWVWDKAAKLCMECVGLA